MSTTTKTPYATILPIARRLHNALAPYCHRLELAGSLRRGRPMVGDIELVAIPRRPRDLLGDPLPGPTALDHFLDERAVQFTRRGDKYQQFAYGRYTIDLFLATPATWGSIYTIRTGSADFSKWLVTAQPHGAAPWGLVFQGGRLHAHGRLLSTPEETDVFNALGLAYIDPALRTGPLPDAARIDPIWNYA
jgi:DNA polymerase/3'-5' exonuclease PolX